MDMSCPQWFTFTFACHSPISLANKGYSKRSALNNEFVSSVSTNFLHPATSGFGTLNDAAKSIHKQAMLNQIGVI